MKDDLSRYTLRVEPMLLGYIAEYDGRTKNREPEQGIKKRLRDFEAEHGEIKPDKTDKKPMHPAMHGLQLVKKVLWTFQPVKKRFSVNSWGIEKANNRNEPEPRGFGSVFMCCRRGCVF